MKKRLFSLIVGAGFLMAFPFAAHGEEPPEQSQGLISEAAETLENTVKNVSDQATDSAEAIVEETAKSVEKTEKDTADFTEETTKAEADPVENKAVTSTLKNTGELVKKVVENTIPTAEKAVEEVTKTTEKTTSEIFEATDKTVESLPEVPVVAPVVKEVNKTVKKVTAEVQNTVKKTNETVNKTVDAVTETTAKTVEKATEPVDYVADVPVQEEKPSAVPIPPTPPVAEEEQSVNNKQPGKIEVLPYSEKPVETKEAQEEVPGFIGEKAVEVPTPERSNDEKKVIAEQPVDMGPANFKGEPAAPVKDVKVKPSAVESVQVEKANETVQPESIPASQNERDGDRVSAIVPAPINNSSTHGSVSFGGHSADLGFGTVSDMEILKASTEKLWYHKNSYAIIQWIHTPLRKPPITTPFLDVI